MFDQYSATEIMAIITMKKYATVDIQIDGDGMLRNEKSAKRIIAVTNCFLL